jgi:hypothetical protein
MKLIELEPRWVNAGGDGIRDAAGQPVPARQGIGLTFTCPCCQWRHYVPFANPLDGGPAHDPSRPVWDREGETFDRLTLRPSILSSKEKGGCGWHGYITGGEVTNA